MNKSETESIVRKINEYICGQMWMDFDVVEYKDYKLLITGSIDPSTSVADIAITFEDVFFIALPFSWQTDTSKAAFELVSEMEAKEINSKFKVEQGNYIFKFVAEDYPADFGCLIGAKKISFQTL